MIVVDIPMILLHTTGRDETEVDMLRSILAQLEYRYQVRTWDTAGVPFRTCMYVPEIHPATKAEFHEREDFAHVLKVIFDDLILESVCICLSISQRIAKSARLGGPNQLQLDRFTEALYDESSGLTFPALTGQRKQSVKDAENLFSEGIEKFMKKKGYT